jgi:hypothetical protein
LKSEFRALWQWWKRTARKIGDAQARLMLMIFYVVIVGPFALVIRFWSRPLRLNSNSPPGWTRIPDRDEPAEERAREQF